MAAEGVKVTLIVQNPFTARVAGLTGQLLVCAKSPGLVPVTVMLLMVTVPGPLLVRVMACALLVVFTVWFGKLMEDGAGDNNAALELVSPVTEVKKVPGLL